MIDGISIIHYTNVHHGGKILLRRVQRRDTRRRESAMITILSVRSLANIQGLAKAAMRLAQAAVGRIAATARAAVHRSEIRQLLELDDRQLKDIGLLRNDVLGALAQPIVRDPSIALLVRSVERRSRLRNIEPCRREDAVPVET